MGSASVAIVLIAVVIQHTLCLRLGERNGLRLFYATCSQGVAPILAKEVAKLPDLEESSVKQVKSGVFFKGTSMTGFSALMNLRCSLRLMEQVNDVALTDEGASLTDIKTPQELYDYCFDAVEWENLIDPGLTFSVSMTLGKEVPQDLAHSHFSALTIKDAIVDKVIEEFDERPSVDKREPDVPIISHLHKGTLSVYRCWSGGTSLHKRGYRGSTIHKAALRETLGAAIVLASNWDGSDGTVLLDPMGGSGTICIEAALIACDTAPGLIRYRDRVPEACNWPDLRGSKTEWQSVVSDAKARDNRLCRDEKGADDISGGSRKLIVYNDVHEGSIDLAEDASERAGVAHLIDFSPGPCDVADLEPYGGEGEGEGRSSPLVILTNPPWDRRLDDNAEHSWDSLRRYLDKVEAEVFCLAGEPSLVKRLGLRPVQNLALHVGDVEMRLLKFSHHV